jgi:hypothetical protein
MDRFLVPKAGKPKGRTASAAFSGKDEIKHEAATPPRKKARVVPKWLRGKKEETKEDVLEIPPLESVDETKQREPPRKLAEIVPSKQQKIIMQRYADGYNVLVQAMAGAAKSRTVQLVATIMVPNEKCLFLTYNKALQEDVHKQLQEEQLDNTTVRTFHSAAGIAYGYTIRDDMALREAVKTRPKYAHRLACDGLFIDEGQDLTFAYAMLLLRLMQYAKERGRILKLMFVGDEGQSVNKYKGARPEFLTQCHRVFNTGRPWVSCILDTSYRLTPSNAEFVAVHVLQCPGAIKGGNTWSPNVKPKYLAVSYNSLARDMEPLVRKAIKTHGIGNVAIIAPSIKGLLRGSDNPLTELVRTRLVGVLTYIPSSDDGFVDDKLAHDKLLICSWNSFKGRQRVCIFVVSFDEGCFKVFRDWSPFEPGLPEVAYVAATRAIKEVYFVADASKTFRTIDVKQLSKHATIIGEQRHRVKPPQFDSSAARGTTQMLLSPKSPREVPSSPTPTPMPSSAPKSISVADLLAHMDVETTYKMHTHVIRVGEVEQVKFPKRKSEKDFIVSFGTYHESVASLYATVLPAVAETIMNGKSDFGAGVAHPNVVENIEQVRPCSTDITRASLAYFPRGFWETVVRAYERPADKRSWTEWLQLAVAHNALFKGALHVARQITHYKWVDSEFVNEAATCMADVLKDHKGAFRRDLPPSRVCETEIYGQADFMETGDEKGTIWMFKSVSEVRDEHILELACNLALAWHSKRIGKLYEIRSGKITTIRVKDPKGLLEKALDKFSKKATGDIVQDFVKWQVDNGVEPLEDLDSDDDDTLFRRCCHLCFDESDEFKLKV